MGLLELALQLAGGDAFGVGAFCQLRHHNALLLQVAGYLRSLGLLGGDLVPGARELGTRGSDGSVAFDGGPLTRRRGHDLGLRGESGARSGGPGQRERTRSESRTGPRRATMTLVGWRIRGVCAVVTRRGQQHPSLFAQVEL
ncbi:MAG: hypothetical protein ACYCXN_05165 [Acidimicrobiales bacterium]